MNLIHDISLYTNIRDRDLKREGIVIAEGRHLVGRLIQSNMKILSILCSERMADEFRGHPRVKCPLHVIRDGEMEGIAGFHFHRGVMAAAVRTGFITLEQFFLKNAPCRNLTICPRLSNDENLGSIIRASAALGADAVVIGPQSCDPLSRRALKVSMGAAFSIPIVMLDDEESGFALLKRYGFTVYGASICGDSIPLHAVKPAEKRAAVFGNESEGLTDRITSLCDETIHIPMYNDTDSLNVAVAAGIILYCLFSSL